MKKTMDMLASGERVEITATDPGFPRDAAADVYKRKDKNFFIYIPKLFGSFFVLESSSPALGH